MYDASLGRWHTQDPLAEGFSSMTPYHYVKNNPVRLFDPNGMADNESFAEWTKRQQDEDKETSDDHNARFSSINLGGSTLENLIATTSEEDGKEQEKKKKTSSNEGETSEVSVLEKLNNWMTAVGFATGSASFNIGVNLNNASRFRPITQGGFSITQFSSNQGWKWLGLRGGKALSLGSGLTKFGVFLSGASIVYTAAQMRSGEISRREGWNDIRAGVTGLFGLAGMGFAGTYYGMKAMGQFDPGFQVSVSEQNNVMRKSLIHGSQNGTQYYMNVTPMCFKKGTLIMLSNGDMIKIEDAHIGSTVLTYNTESCITEKGVVVNVLSRDVSEIYKLTLYDDIIYVTSEHPFFVVGKGWIKVCDLTENSQLISNENEIVLIKSIEKQIEKISVYNITVEKNHNYFVGKQKVLVHNK